jgi:serine/threonine protein kinase
MVGFDGSGRVLDFGIARRLGAARRTVAGMVRGTSAYMAPEQAVDKKMDTRSDLFSLGIVLHELLTGKRLFYKGNPALEMAAVYEGPILAPSAVHKRVPAALDAVVLKALTRNVAQRYQTALDLVADVEKVAGESMWSQPRSAALVADKFANRQVEIQALGSRVGGTDLLVQPTTPGWPVFKTLDAPLPFTVSRPSSSSNPDARETPMLGDGVDTPTDSVSSSRLSESDLWQPAGRAATPRGAQPQGANLSSTEESDLASTPKRRWALALGALAAIAAGAVTGLLVYRVSVSSAGVSITAPRPIEVAFKGKSLGLTPLRDVTLPAGMQQLEVREGDGPWRPLEIEVAAQTATRVDVVLDAAP